MEQYKKYELNFFKERYIGILTLLLKIKLLCDISTSFIILSVAASIRD